MFLAFKLVQKVMCFYRGNNVSQVFTASISKKKHCSCISPEREDNEHLQKPRNYAQRHTGDDYKLS
jgi:hypothetical protein